VKLFAYFSLYSQLLFPWFYINHTLQQLQVHIDRHGTKLLKLGDFGLAQVVTEPLYTVCGTPTYVAPEILAETGYGLKVSYEV
jgi:serine/threonine protein kinase